MKTETENPKINYLVMETKTKTNNPKITYLATDKKMETSTKSPKIHYLTMETSTKNPKIPYSISALSAFAKSNLTVSPLNAILIATAPRVAISMFVPYLISLIPNF
jgi:hypothetical protein